MEPDIQYLLWLQDLRILSGGIFDEFFNLISKFAVNVMPFLPCIVFWALDRGWGYRYMFALSGGELFNNAVKLTVCAYRPWIRSSLIKPAGDSIVAATGYSFPSGHTMSATSTYGTTIVWQHRKRKWLAVLCGIMIFLTGFSRNFLGVHTPQDVIAGIAETVVLIFLVGLLAKCTAGNDRWRDILTLAGILVAVAVLIYIKLKSYPMDYVDGKLLVDPVQMMNDCFKACGAFIGMMIASFIERHYIHYEIPAPSAKLAVFTVIGGLIVVAWKVYIAKVTIVAALGGHWGNFCSRFLLMFFAVAVWPFVLKKICGGPKEKSAQA